MLLYGVPLSDEGTRFYTANHGLLNRSDVIYHDRRGMNIGYVDGVFFPLQLMLVEYSSVLRGCIWHKSCTCTVRLHLLWGR